MKKRKNVFFLLAVFAAGMLSAENSLREQWDFSKGAGNWQARSGVTLAVDRKENALQITDSSEKRGFAMSAVYPVRDQEDYEFSCQIKSMDGKTHASKVMIGLFQQGKMVRWAGITPIKTDGEWKTLSIRIPSGTLKGKAEITGIAPAIFPEDKASERGSILVRAVRFFSTPALLTLNWYEKPGSSGWSYVPSGKEVRINPKEKYYNKHIFDFDTADGSIAESSRTFPVHPGKKYALSGMLRIKGPGSENANGEKDLAQMAALLATGSVYDVAVGIAYLDRQGKQKWIVKENLRFDKVWTTFHLPFELPSDEKEAVSAKALITVFQKNAIFQAAKLCVYEGTVRTYSIAPFVNRPYRNTDSAPGWTGDGDHDIRAFQGGKLEFSGIPFEVPSSGAIGLSRRKGFLPSVVLPFQKRVDFLYLLNTAAWAPKKKWIGSILWKYEDGSSARKKILSGDHTGDWFATRMQTPRFAYMNEVFGISLVARSVQFFVTPVWNPNPEKKVVSVILESSPEKEPIWMILGVSWGMGGNIAGKREQSAEKLKQDRTGWYPFDMRVRKTVEKPLVDLRQFLDAPAGKHGFLQIRNGHFVFEDGTPARFIGTELGAEAVFPSREDAEAVADTMARYGINMVRLRMPAADNAFNNSRWHPKNATDRFDYFFACLKKRGIYVFADLSSPYLQARYRAAGGFPGLELYFPQNRPWHYYDEAIQTMWLKFVQQDFSRVNKYTGLSYFDDPALALTLCFNESSLLWDYRTKRGVPEYYKTLLRRKFSGFLMKKYGNRQNVAKAWAGSAHPLPEGEDPEKGNVTPLWNWQLNQAGDKPSRRDRDSLLFYYSLQKKFNTEIRGKLKKMGLRTPVATTNAGRTPEIMDFTSQNTYYDHTRSIPLFNEKGKWIGFSWECSNVPETLVNPMLSLTLQPGIAGTKLAGIPQTATETDIMWPNDYRSTHMVQLVAAGSLQNWDMFLQFAFLAGNHLTWERAKKSAQILFPAVEYNDPAIYGPYPAMAIAWLRRDIAPGKRLIQTRFSADDFEKNIQYRSYAFPQNVATWISRLEHTYGEISKDADVVVGSAEGTALPSGTLLFPVSALGRRDQHDRLPARFDRFLKKNHILDPDKGLQDNRIVSDTGEIVRDWGHGRTTINTPRTQGFTGFVTSDRIKLSNVEIEMEQKFATVLLTSLDGLPLSDSKRILLTTVGKAGNSEDTVTYRKSVTASNNIRYEIDISAIQARKGTVVAEPIFCTLKLKGKAAALTPLTPAMTAASVPVKIEADHGILTVKSTGSSPWSLLEITR